MFILFPNIEGVLFSSSYNLWSGDSFFLVMSFRFFHSLCGSAKHITVTFPHPRRRPTAARRKKKKPGLSTNKKIV
jgi:hypothetical protein